MNRKYLVAVALLAILAVVFGLAGTFAPVMESVSPPESSSSESVAHFVNPPTYDSGWLDIRDKVGQNFSLTHGLNTTEVSVYVTGRTLQIITGGDPAWNKTYGGASYDRARSVVQTSDGGYALAGYTTSYGGGNFWLVKTDSAGNMQWHQTYGGYVAYSIVQTSDGGYAMVGSGGSVWLVKTDSAGNMQWNKGYGGDNVGGYSVVQTIDGGYAIAGYTGSYGAGRDDFWLVKTDSAGNIQWHQTYGGAEIDVAYSIVQTSDGGYALGGGTYSYGDGTPANPNFYLVKTDSAGNMQWHQTYGGALSDEAYSVVQTGDGGYALAGYTISYGGGANFYLVKTDSAGNMQWSKTYGGTGGDYANSMVQTSDGGYAIAGWTNSYGAGNWDFWLVKTDSSGNTQWNKTYGGAEDDIAYSVVQANDLGYAIVGYTYSYGAGNWDFWLVKTVAGIEMGPEHQRNFGTDSGLALTELTNNTITLYRSGTDAYWDYVCVRIRTIKEPTWVYGDINMDGIVDAKDLYILGRNYGKTFSLLSLSGIIAIAGIRIAKKRKQNT